MRNASWAWLWFVGWAWLALAADGGVARGGDAARPRVVTLAPALTQMVVDLGRGEALVGVTDKDTAAPAGLPVVGNFVDLDTERLLSVGPTHLLQMVSKEGDAALTALGERGGFAVVPYRYPVAIEEVADILWREGGAAGGPPSVGEVVGVPERAAALRAAMLRFFDDLGALTAGEERPRVLLAIGTNPLMASGPGTVHDGLLAYAGGVNAAAGASVTAPTYDREAVLALDPAVILVLSPGRSGSDAGAMASLVPELRALPIEAVERGRVVLINDPATLLPSTSLPRVAAAMASAIHPELRGEVSRLLAAYDAARDWEAADADDATDR